jgi:hypothetical protein
MQKEKALVAAEVAKLPAEFGLRAWPGKRFRIDPDRSYFSNVYDSVQLVVQVKYKEAWLDFSVNPQKVIVEFIQTI